MYDFRENQFKIREHKNLSEELESAKSKIINLEKEKMEHEKEFDRIKALISVPRDKLESFFESGELFFEENRRLIVANSSKSDEALKIIFINYHTMKGLARRFQFKSLVNYLHDAEHQCAEIRINTKEWSQDQLLEKLTLAKDDFFSYVQSSRVAS